jgi:hypothetical protein
MAFDNQLREERGAHRVYDGNPYKQLDVVQGLIGLHAVLTGFERNKPGNAEAVEQLEGTLRAFITNFPACTEEALLLDDEIATAYGQTTYQADPEVLRAIHDIIGPQAEIIAENIEAEYE